jgi:indole-3-glycerol phosphate synthase
MKPGLQDIVSRKQQDLLKQKIRLPLSRLQAGLRRAAPARGFVQALFRPGSVSLIAELKRASPSAGLLRAPYDVAYVARAYARAGARALSVLTEENFFQGNLSHLALAKQAALLPVLRKDFIFDPYQIYESRFYGADAVLLIVALLPAWRLRSLLQLTRALGMTPLVEVHEEEELQAALKAGADVIGINSRNLKDLSMNPNIFRRLVPLVPKNRVVVAESGIRDEKDVKSLKKLKVHAMLVGESLLRQRDLEGAARNLIQAKRGF